MTRIVLDIPNNNDVEFLLPLLKRLRVIVSNQPNELTESERQYHEMVFEKGGKTIENFEEFMADFEKSRVDKELDRLDMELKAELEKVIKEKGYTEEDYHRMLNSKS
jgi:heterodisulfide reductase subunit C